MYLDTLQLQYASVGYGHLGMHGSLGYEDKCVKVKNRQYQHALSTHPPASLRFRLDGCFTSFWCRVALNDDVQPCTSYAQFCVIADGKQVASVIVTAGETPRSLYVDVSGVHQLELQVSTSYWEYSHAVWLDPQVDDTRLEGTPGTLIDCLRRAEITLPVVKPKAKRCIATVVSPGFQILLDDMLGSLYANGNCQDALLVVFALNPDAECERIVDKYKGTFIRCRSYTNVNATSKSLLYSVARVVDAQYFLCLDADMLVLGDLNPVFSIIEACPEGSIFACRENNSHSYINLEHALCSVYGGQSSDIERLLETPDAEGTYSLVVNDGTFAGGHAALLNLDGMIRSMTSASTWTDARPDIWWRNQFVFNLALARLSCGVELNEMYNIQLNGQDAQIYYADGRVRAKWNGCPACVLHFNGLGRSKYPEWRNLFALIPDPLVEPGGGDGYSTFLALLRSWIGRYGLHVLAWSFYGSSDTLHARVRDPDTMPLFALLHYLIRSNGCISVLETGTARGVSAACLASAVAHRERALVVTFDPESYPEREVLWESLPEVMRQCINYRATTSFEGMKAAIDAGEHYHAALLDSIHLEEHVWIEFQLATQLVCPGGLILVHDACYVHGTVEKALQRIEAAGYNVVRLWTAECGVLEDDRLGLAIIENRRKL